MAAAASAAMAWAIWVTAALPAVHTAISTAAALPTTTFTMAAGSLVHAILKRAYPEWTREYVQSFAAGGLVGEALIGIVIATLLVTGVLN